MPIAFPPRTQATILNNVAAVRTLNLTIQNNPNMGRIGTKTITGNLDPGIGIPKMVNLASPGIPFADRARNATVNPISKAPLSLSAKTRIIGTQNMYMSGITRDNAAAPLGNVRVMVFRTQDNTFVGETTSDGSGNWSMLLLKSGPFFEVCYKVGSPDICGTSVNTLTPIPG